jgi:hypothetical protein
VIVFAGVLVGLETDGEIVARHGGVLHALDEIVATRAWRRSARRPTRCRCSRRSTS